MVSGKSMTTLLLHAVACSLILVCGGCFLSGEDKIDEGVVIAQKLKIRSSTAMVALDLVEVKRGDRLDILDQAEVKTPTRTEEWYKVRTKSDGVVGWVKAQDLVSKTIIERIEELYAKSKDVPSQGRGRLKVPTRLRVEPDGDVVTYLSRGVTVEIVGKARTVFKPEKQRIAEDGEETTEEPEARTILWYQVRLPDADVLQAGWVGAQQVQLDVPDEILHLEGEGRRFTGWVVYDQVKDREGKIKSTYIGMMKRLSTEAPVDFTRIWVLTYSPPERRYIGARIEDGLRGVLPILLGTPSGRSGFTIHELDGNGNTVAVEYEAVRDGARLRVNRLSPKIEVKSPVRPRR